MTILKIWRNAEDEKLRVQTDIQGYGCKGGKVIDYDRMKTLMKAGWTWHMLKTEFSFADIDQAKDFWKAVQEPMKAYLQKEYEKVARKAAEKARQQKEKEKKELEAYLKRRRIYV